MKFAFLESLTLENLKSTALRFPLSILSAAVAMVSTIWTVQHVYDAPHYLTVEALGITAFLGILLFSGLALFAERYRLRSWLIQLVGIPVLYFLIFRQHDNFSDLEMIRNGLVFLSSLALVFSGPYLLAGENKGFWIYFVRVLNRALFAIATSIITVVALSLALVSIENLFSVAVDGRWYEYIYSVFIIFVPTVVFLMGVPSDFKKLEKETFAVSYRAVSTYLFAPLLSVYFLILAAYVVKILFTQVWPEGFVAMPILIFTTIGFGMYTLVFPSLEEKTSRFLRVFARSFLWSLPIFMLVYFGAFWQRIEQYGVTEMRYLGVMLGVLILAWSLYFVLSRNPRLKVIPATVFVVGFLISFGSWGVFGVSEYSQHARLETLLSEAGLLKDGAVASSDDEAVDEGARRRISGALDYLIDNYGSDSVTDLFPAGDDPDDNTSSGIMERLGLTYEPEYDWYDDSIGTYYSFNANSSEPSMTKGYDYSMDYYFYQYLRTDTVEDSSFVLNKTQTLVLHYNPEIKAIEASVGQKKVTVPVGQFIEKLQNGEIDELEGDAGFYSRENLSVMAENSDLSIKFYFGSISYYLKEEVKKQINFDAQVLVRVK